VKVADFGLVKDVQNSTMSLMGGMTPMYASPEVFDGRPSRHSDQYSLAITYQELLTGLPPFCGKTPSQLISQHLHGSPRLTPLPAHDQLIIARALSKDPSQRYGSCREMVENLSKAKSPQPLNLASGPAGSAAQNSTGSGSARRTPQHTQPWTPQRQASSGGGPLPAMQPAAELAEPERAPLTASKPVAAVRTLPAMDIPQDEIGFRPTLVLGIGGTGMQTLQRLSRRLRDRFGDPAAVPALRMLLVDTDLKTIARATEASEGHSLDSEDTLVMPLRKRQDYRADSEQFLQWLSRRWLYNIPRSLQTEGMRPLGRLALVDHSDKLFDRIWRAISAITTPEAVAATAAAVGMPVKSHAPRVFIVASISGGTGSGMVLDMGYAVRMVLASLGIAEKGVCGILTHGTGRNCDAKDLAIANAYACLGELHHYNRVGRQTDHPAVPMQTSGENLGAFDDTYLIHLGDDLSGSEMGAATDAVAEYLYLNEVTAAGTFFDKCREDPEPTDTADDDSPPAETTVRTLGLCQIGCSQSTLPANVANLLCRQVVTRWCGDAESETAEPDGAEELQLDLDRFTAEVCELVRSEVGTEDEAESYLRSRLAQNNTRRKRDQGEAEMGGSLSHLFTTINNLLGTRSNNDNLLTAVDGSLQEALDAPGKELVARHEATIRDWILERAERSNSSISETRLTTEWVLDRLNTLGKRAAVTLQRMQVPLVQFEHVLLATSTQAGDQSPGWFGRLLGRQRTAEIDPQWVTYFRFRLDQAMLHQTCVLLRSIRERVSTIVDQLKDLGQELSVLADELADSSGGTADQEQDGSSPALRAFYLSVAEALHDRIPQLAAEVDHQLHNEFFMQHGGLRGVLEKKIDLRGPFSEVLRDAARTAVFRTLNQMNIAELLLDTASPAADDTASPAADDTARSDQESNHLLGSLLEAAAPVLPQCGGSQRLVLVCPESSNNGGTASPASSDAGDARLQETFRRQLDEKPSVVHDSDGDLVLCFEAQGIPLATVATRLVDNRADYAQAASRLHTRIDVSWSPLISVPCLVGAE
ncbi:MAG: protein kinase, partial [Candidatus Nealsonbacteria bacterium]|nr:protein kinase [Candidatus Nealsonbacteria bacterium]